MTSSLLVAGFRGGAASRSGSGSRSGPGRTRTRGRSPPASRPPFGSSDHDGQAGVVRGVRNYEAAGRAGGCDRAVEPLPGSENGGQWAQARAVPESSAVRKLDPQPQAATAFGLLTVKPAPISVST